MKLFFFINISLLLVGAMIYFKMKSSQTPSNAKLIIEAWDHVLKAEQASNEAKGGDKSLSTQNEKEI